MSVWFTIPSARPPAEANAALARWRARGYKLAIFRDVGAEPVHADLMIFGEYKGYAAAVNQLCRAVMDADPAASFMVTGGDDVHCISDFAPEVIAAQCEARFGGTLGVMEPTGDRWMVDRNGKCAAERVCIAPWMGREWCRRGYGGKGPLWEGYEHFYCDEEHARVAEKLGILWQRPDLTQYHEHWSRNGGERPAFLEKARLGWDAAKELFESRQAAGFPGHELLPA